MFHSAKYQGYLISYRWGGFKCPAYFAIPSIPHRKEDNICLLSPVCYQIWFYNSPYIMNVTINLNWIHHIIVDSGENSSSFKFELSNPSSNIPFHIEIERRNIYIPSRTLSAWSWVRFPMRLNFNINI